MFNGLTDPEFTGGIGVGGVNIGDAVVKAALNNTNGFVLSTSLDWYAPKPNPGNHKICSPESDFFHYYISCH